MENNLNLPEKSFKKSTIVFALFLLCNPNIAYFDILPDFIGCFILASFASFFAKRVPFFEEARSGFIKLGILSVARFPALLLVTFIRNANTADNDIIALVSLVFSVLEAIFAYGCIKDLFAGISHLGTRTGKVSIIGENPSSDFLCTLTYIFMGIKCAVSAIPEFARLTTADGAGTITTGLEGLRYYPMLLVIGQALGYAVGLVWLAYFTRYLTNLEKADDLYTSALELSTPQKEAEIALVSKLEKVKSGLWLTVPAAFISFDFALDLFKGVNILPHFILGILLIFAVLKLSYPKTRTALITVCLGGLFVLSALGTWCVSIVFHSRYTFTDVARYEEAAEFYWALELLGLIEFILLIPFLVFFTVSLIGFIKVHTGKTATGYENPFISDSENPYSAFDRSYHKSLTTRAWIFFSLGALSGLARLLMVFINANREFSDGVFMPTVAPWFSVIELIITAVWGFFTYMLVNTLTEDFDMKYSHLKHSFNQK